MKLSESTIEILKNFAVLNPALQFRKGSALATITPGKTVLAKARVVESFPFDFVISDLNRFLAKLSLYKECELEFKTDRVIFRSTDGRRSDEMVFSSAKAVTLPPADKTVTLDSADHSFDLSQDDLQWQRKSAGISGSEHLVFRGHEGKIYMQSTDLKNDAADFSSTEVGKTDGKFRYVIRMENCKMLDGAYTVSLQSKPKALAQFKHKDKPVEYLIALESTLSEF